MSSLPPLSLAQIFRLSFGFLGIQFGWGLQMANMSAIYQYLGAEEGDIPLLWLAAPVTGLLVQPIIGHFSDRTWTRLGRRRPYFLVGALCASAALVAMPNSSSLWMAAGLLWLLDASVNVSMEPFRAFVGDLLPPAQRKVGFAVQSLLIGFGAILSSSLPWLLTHVFGVASATDVGSIPQAVHLAFYIGAAVFLGAVLVTVLTTSEHPPADWDAFQRERTSAKGLLALPRELIQGVREMPPTLRRLAGVQFFTWLGLFCLWIYFTPAVARSLYGAEPGSPAYQEAVEWTGVCFSTYNGVAFLFAFALVPLARRYSALAIHRVCLLLAAAGMASIGLWTEPFGLLVSMVGIGVGWASILSMPYAVLANAIPSGRMGFFMGVFNIFIVLPQIAAATLLGPLVRLGLEGAAMPVVVGGGGSLALAAVALNWVREEG